MFLYYKGGLSSEGVAPPPDFGDPKVNDYYYCFAVTGKPQTNRQC